MLTRLFGSLALLLAPLPASAALMQATVTGAGYYSYLIGEMTYGYDPESDDILGTYHPLLQTYVRGLPTSFSIVFDTGDSVAPL